MISGTQASDKIKFLHVRMTSGDLAYQMQALANAVVIAKLLNATLVVPALKSDEDDSQKHGCVMLWSMTGANSILSAYLAPVAFISRNTATRSVT